VINHKHLRGAVDSVGEDWRGWAHRASLSGAGAAVATAWYDAC